MKDASDTDTAAATNGTTEGGDDTKLLSLLKDATKSDSTRIKLQDYHKRLFSFNPSTYYAKPACLSPLYCARFGWRNADKDMLSCSSCRAALAILPVPSNLSVTSMDKLCAAYRMKIATNHKDGCVFGLGKHLYEEIIEENSKNTSASSSTIVPSYMASVIAENYIQMMEHPTPSALVRYQVKEIISLLPKTATKGTIWRFPKLQVPLEIQQFAFTDAKLMLESDDEATVALAILGWAPAKKMKNSVPTAYLGCPLCLATMELDLESDVAGKDKAERGRPTKRLRTLAKHCNPVDAHRYYCPYQSGFPSSIVQPTNPVWKRILERLLQEKKHFDAIGTETGQPTEHLDLTENDMDQSIEKVRRILRGGIVKTTIEISIEE